MASLRTDCDNLGMMVFRNMRDNMNLLNFIFGHHLFKILQ